MDSINATKAEKIELQQNAMVWHLIRYTILILFLIFCYLYYSRARSIQELVYIESIRYWPIHNKKAHM